MDPKYTIAKATADDYRNAVTDAYEHEGDMTYYNERYGALAGFRYMKDLVAVSVHWVVRDAIACGMELTFENIYQAYKEYDYAEVLDGVLERDSAILDDLVRTFIKPAIRVGANPCLTCARRGRCIRDDMDNFRKTNVRLETCYLEG